MANMTKEQVAKALTEAGVEFDPSASYNDLRKLLKESQNQEEPTEEVATPVIEVVETKPEILTPGIHTMKITVKHQGEYYHKGKSYNFDTPTVMHLQSIGAL